MHIGELLMAVVVFYSIISFIKIMSMHFLKRKIIKTGHIDKAEILGQNVVEDKIQKVESYDKYPALKWGLIAFFGGLGFIVLELLGRYVDESFISYRSSMPYGIFFMFVAIGFLTYYFIVKSQDKDKR